MPRPKDPTRIPFGGAALKYEVDPDWSYYGSLIFDPTTGSEQRQYIDAETYLPIRLVMTVNVPQLGQDVEQITDFLDYKEVDGIKIPFRLKSSSSIQNFTITVSKVEHNAKVDDTLFVKPAQ